MMQEGAQLPYVETFVIAAESSSFTSAANTLGLTQAAVSQRIATLETTLGIRLFDRRGGRVVLTEAGKRLHVYAEQILELHRSARHEIAGRDQPVHGELLVAASSVPGEYLLPGLLRAFGQKHQHIRVRATVTDSVEAMAQLDRGDVHLGLVGWRGESPDRDCRLIGHDNMVLVVPPGHPLGKRKTVTMDQLSAEPLILREAGSGQRHSFAESLSRAGKSLSELRVVLELGSNEAIKEAIQRGMGLAVLSTFVVEKELRAATLRTIKIKDINCQRDLYVVQNRRRVLPMAARLFLEHVTAHCL